MSQDEKSSRAGETSRRQPYHVAVLLEEFERRVGKNPRYSIRAFARFLSLHPSAVSRIFSGKQELSLRACPKVLKKLSLMADVQRLFLASVLAERNKKQMLQISKFIAPTVAVAKRTPSQVDNATFEKIADFDHVAVLEATMLDGGEHDQRGWIARRLNLPKDRVEEIIAGLLHAGLLTSSVDGNLKKTFAHLTTQDRQSTSEALKRHQRQVMAKAAESLTVDPFESRTMVTMCVPTDPVKIAAAREMINEFMEQLSDFLESGHRTILYQCSVQFFPITRDDS